MQFTCVVYIIILNSKPLKCIPYIIKCIHYDCMCIHYTILLMLKQCAISVR